MNVVNGDTVVLPDNATTYPIVVTDLQLVGDVKPNLVSYLVTPVTGSVKFGIGSISANAGAVASGTNKIFQCAPGTLVAKPTTNNDSFYITTLIS